MFVSFLRAIVVLCCLASVTAALAQENDPASTQRAALRSLPSACADYARLCPQPGDGAIGAGALLICLKDHTVDVSLRCRRALAAAQATRPAAP